MRCTVEDSFPHQLPIAMQGLMSDFQQGRQLKIINKDIGDEGSGIGGDM